MLAGDEVGNSQGGNNNAYCQDNEIGWVDWSGLRRQGDDMTEFVGGLTRLRKRFPQLRPRHWLEGKKADGTLRRAVAAPRRRRDDRGGLEFSRRAFPLLRAGAAGRRAASRCFMVLNAAPDAIEVTLPAWPGVAHWSRVLDTATGLVLAEDGAEAAERQAHGAAALDPGVRGQAMSERAPRFGPLITRTA